MLASLTPLLLFALSAGPLQFSGSASMYSEYGWVNGDTLVEPRPELRFNINPSLSLFGFPIGMNMLVSTQENPLKQQLDKFKLFLNPRRWLESQTNLSGLALSFKTLELGSCNPSWTPYTLAGAPVFGGAVELNPGQVFLAAAGGRNQRRVDVTDSSQGAYARMLYSGRFGFGRKEKAHFFLTGLYAVDDTTSPKGNRIPNPNDPDDTINVVRPQENYVVGAEFVADANDGQARLETEISGCEVTPDARVPTLGSFADIGLEAVDPYLGWTIPYLHPRLNSSFDFAWKVRPIVNWYGTKMFAKVEMVGPGYKSLGAPGLRNDNFAYGVGISGSYFDNAVSVSGSYEKEHDNLLRTRVTDDVGRLVRVLTLKSATSQFTRWQTSLNLALPNLPYIQVSYCPYTQANDSLDSIAEVVSTKTSVGRNVSASAGHSFQTGKVSHSPSVSVSFDDLRGAEFGGNYTSWDANVNYGLGFESPFSISAGCGYSRTTPDSGDVDSRLSIDLTPSYTLFEKWTHSLSLGGTFDAARRIDVRYSTSFPVWKICDGNVGISDGIYKGDDGSYNDVRLTAELSKSW